MRRDGRIVVSGSVAFDYLMTFPGRFTEHLIPDRMARLSVSFLVDEMRLVPGGCGPNIASGLALRGGRPSVLCWGGGSSWVPLCPFRVCASIGGEWRDGPVRIVVQ